MKSIKPLFGTIAMACGLSVCGFSQTFLTNGLVAYYPFDGKANDATAYHNNPTLNTATLSTNRFGQPLSAYDFGQSEYIGYTNAPQLAFGPQTSLGVFAWIKFNANLPGFSGIVSKMNNDTNASTGFQIGIVANTLQAQIGSPPAVTFQGATVLNDGRWHAVGLVVERTNSTAQVFVDGKLDGAITNSNLTQDLSCTDPLLFGVERNYSIFFTGTIDDIRIYNRALSDFEVQQLYVFESGPRIDLIKAVKPTFFNLTLTTNYQLQVSTDLTIWTNSGAAFMATNSNMVYPQYFDLENWNQLFFRLEMTP